MLFALPKVRKAVESAISEKFTVKEKAQPFYLRDERYGTVAVLIHGFTGSPYDMREFGDYLFGNGINVYGLRLAGHGTSPYDLLQTTYADWVQSVEEAVRMVAEDHGQVFLIGYSFGGNLALELAARQPQRFAGVICLGASIYLRMSGPTQFYLRYLNYGLRFFGKHFWRKPYVPRDKTESWEATGNYALIPLKSMLDWKYFIDHHTIKQIEHITTPILIMHSRNDRVSHPKSSEYLFEYIGSEYKEMFILPEFNHNPLRSDSRDKIFSKAMEFINAHVNI